MTFPLPQVPGLRQPTIDDCCLNNRLLVNTKPGYGPDALLAGVQKAGTSWLHSVLTKRAAAINFRCDADFPDGRQMHRHMKEVHFFDLLPVKQGWVDDYLQGFPPNATASVRIDATPSMSRSSFSPCRIKMLFPKAKIVLLLRDPAERAMSSWLMAVGKRNVPTSESLTVEAQKSLYVLSQRQCTFGMKPISTQSPKLTMLRLLDSRSTRVEKCHNPSSSSGRGSCSRSTTSTEQQSKEQVQKSWRECFGCEGSPPTRRGWHGCFPPRDMTHDDYPPDWELPKGSYVSRGMYAPMLAWWLEYFPPEQLLIVNSKAMKNKPVQVANRIATFLGIKYVLQPKDILYENGTAVNFTPRQHQNWTAPDEDSQQKLQLTQQLLQYAFEPLNKQLYLLLEYYGYSFTKFEVS